MQKNDDCRWYTACSLPAGQADTALEKCEPATSLQSVGTRMAILGRERGVHRHLIPRSRGGSSTLPDLLQVPELHPSPSGRMESSPKLSPCCSVVSLALRVCRASVFLPPSLRSGFLRNYRLIHTSSNALPDCTLPRLHPATFRFLSLCIANLTKKHQKNDKDLGPFKERCSCRRFRFPLQLHQEVLLSKHSLGHGRASHRRLRLQRQALALSDRVRQGTD